MPLPITLEPPDSLSPHTSYTCLAPCLCPPHSSTWCEGRPPLSTPPPSVPLSFLPPIYTPLSPSLPLSSSPVITTCLSYTTKHNWQFVQGVKKCGGSCFLATRLTFQELANMNPSPAGQCGEECHRKRSRPNAICCPVNSLAGLWGLECAAVYLPSTSADIAVITSLLCHMAVLCVLCSFCYHYIIVTSFAEPV